MKVNTFDNEYTLSPDGEIIWPYLTVNQGATGSDRVGDSIRATSMKIQYRFVVANEPDTSVPFQLMGRIVVFNYKADITGGVPEPDEIFNNIGSGDLPFTCFNVKRWDQRFNTKILFTETVCLDTFHPQRFRWANIRINKFIQYEGNNELNKILKNNIGIFFISDVTQDEAIPYVVLQLNVRIQWTDP